MMDRYVVGRCGSVFSPFGRRLAQSRDKDGYPVVYLHQGGKTFKRRPHRLVAQQYIPNPDGLPEVNHKDEVKHNCWDWNLEWMSLADNRNHGTRNERIKKTLAARKR